MIYKINHETRYLYGTEVEFCHNLAHLLPRETEHQKCRYSRLLIQPMPSVSEEERDYFGNRTSHFTIQKPHTELSIQAISEIELQPMTQMGIEETVSWERIRELLDVSSDIETIRAREFCLPSRLIRPMGHYRDYAAVSFPPGIPLLSAVNNLNQRIHQDFSYDPGFTTISTPLEDVFSNRRGVCQDFAHFAIACLRGMGITARYVSGYIENESPDRDNNLVGANQSHAWFSVFLPAKGWYDFDPTNNQIPIDQHITTAWGRDYSDVAPLKGVIFGGGDQQQLSVTVSMERIE